MIAHVPPGKIIESSDRSPHWALLAQLHAVELKAGDPKWWKVQPGESVDLRMPSMNGRAELFGKIFKGNRWVEAGRHAEGEPDAQLFTGAALTRRHPDFVTVSSWDAAMPGKTARDYYAQLLAHATPYVVGFQGSSAPVSRLVYPREIDFLEGAITILERLPAPAGE